MAFLVSFVLAGLALQLAAHLWPVRRVQPPAELPVDAVALVLALVCQVGVAAAAYPLISSIQDVEWVAASYRALVAAPPLLCGLLYFLVVDFFAYWMHRLNHTDSLWSTHAFHHSARNLYWASGMRGSPLHFVLLGLPSLLVLVVYSPEGAVGQLVFVYGVVHNSLIHSNVRVPTRLLNWIFVTGESHMVHHARDIVHGNRNFGFLFTFWDRMFGTWTEPKSLPPDYPLGLAYEVSYPRLMIGVPPPRDDQTRSREAL